MALPPKGVWVARYADRSALHPFGSELEALRHAVKNHMEVAWIPFGEDALTYQGQRPKTTTRTSKTNEGEDQT